MGLTMVAECWVRAMGKMMAEIVCLIGLFGAIALYFLFRIRRVCAQLAIRCQEIRRPFPLSALWLVVASLFNIALLLLEY